MSGVWALAVAGVLGVVLSAHSQEPESIQIRIIYPTDKMSLPAMDRTFIYGSVFPPYARVTVNGIDSPVVQSSLGGWMALVPIQSGKFPLIVQADAGDGRIETRAISVKVDKAAQVSASAAVPIADQAVHKPKEEKILKPTRIGRIVSDTVFLRSGPDEGTEQAGFEVRLQKDVLVHVVGQIDKNLHVRLSDVESLWIDAFAVRLLPRQTPIPESWINGWTVHRLGRISASGAPSAGVSDAGRISRSAAPSAGVSDAGRISRSAAPSAGVSDAGRSTIISTTLQELIPYRVIPAVDGRSISLRLYGGVANTDWIHYAADDPWIRLAVWSQPMEHVYQLDLDLRRPIWGYDIRYENRKLILELYDPPGISLPASPAERPSRRRDRLSAETPTQTLSGVRIGVDPGHPPLGTFGPMATQEHAVNWLLAIQLRDALITRGASVFLTRQDQETVPLPDRVVRARAAGSDLFVSIHTNGLPAGADPFQMNGYSVFYFQPFSHPLAESVHGAMRDQIPLRDDGLHFGNFHVIRQTFMPSILIECAYLIWPPEEELLLNPNFQARIAHAVASGIEQFVRERAE